MRFNLWRMTFGIYPAAANATGHRPALPGENKHAGARDPGAHRDYGNYWFSSLRSLRKRRMVLQASFS